MESANFISESGLHAGLLLPGKIESCCTVETQTPTARTLTWDRTELVNLMELYPGLMSSFKATLSWDVIRKLKAQRTLLKSGVISDPELWTERRLRQTNHRYNAIVHNLLSLDPQSFGRRFRELEKYRRVHHIDDEHHEEALRESGWTLEQFENAKKEQEDHLAPQSMTWYLSRAYYRVFA